MVAAVADGVGGHKGGRDAAETCVRGFIDGYYAQPETLGVARAAGRALESINAWIAAQARVDPKLEGMATTFSALIFSRRTAFLVHVGDTRVYRLRAGDFEQLTSDHVARTRRLAPCAAVARSASRMRCPSSIVVQRRVCTIAFCCARTASMARCAMSICEPSRRAALARKRPPSASSTRRWAGGDDNATALVVDVVDLPAADENALARVVADLPIGEPPKPARSSTIIASRR